MSTNLIGAGSRQGLVQQTIVRANDSAGVSLSKHPYHLRKLVTEISCLNNEYHQDLEQVKHDAEADEAGDATLQSLNSSVSECCELCRPPTRINIVECASRAVETGS